MKMIEADVFKMKEEGKTNGEIEERYGLSKKQLKNLINWHNRAERKIEAGIMPRQRGRQAKGHQVSEQEKDYEIKRLKMENKLLRDFLHLAGRR